MTTFSSGLSASISSYGRRDYALLATRHHLRLPRVGLRAPQLLGALIDLLRKVGRSLPTASSRGGQSGVAVGVESRLGSGA